MLSGKKGRNAEYIFKQVQRAFVSVEEWADKCGFKISAVMSKYMFFGFRRTLPYFGLFMYRSSLERVQDVTFLGFWFDEHMTWTVQIAKILTRCE